MDCIELSTPRLRLQPTSQCEGWELWDLWREPAVRRRVFGDTPFERAAAWSGLNLCVGRTSGLWLIRARRTAHVLGCVSLSPPASAPARHDSHAEAGPSAELTVALLPVVWGCGYACESARAVIAHAFSTSHLELISATTDAADVRGRMMLDRLGFRALREVRSGSKPQVEHELSAREFRPFAEPSQPRPRSAVDI